MRRALRRSLAGLCIVAAAVSLLVMPGAEETEASWVDTETGTATLTALTVPRPQATAQCVASSGLLGAFPKVTIYWRVPEGFSGYTSADAELVNPNGSLIGSVTELLLGNKIESSGTPSGYTLVIKDGLLGGLLGSSKEILLRLKGPGGWYSSDLKILATIGALGSSHNCATTPVPGV